MINILRLVWHDRGELLLSILCVFVGPFVFLWKRYFFKEAPGHRWILFERYNTGRLDRINRVLSAENVASPKIIRVGQRDQLFAPSNDNNDLSLSKLGTVAWVCKYLSTNDKLIIFTTSGDKVAWLVCLCRYFDVSLDIYDIRVGTDAYHRIWLEKTAVIMSKTLLVRDLRSNSRSLRKISRGKRVLIYDPPISVFRSKCEIQRIPNSIIAMGWISGRRKYGYCYETMRTLLERGFHLHIVPGRYQSWTDPMLYDYIKLAADYPLCYLLDPMPPERLCELLRKMKFGLFCCDDDWFNDVIIDESLTRDLGARVIDFADFGLVPIVGQKKKFARKFVKSFCKDYLVFEDILEASDPAFVTLRSGRCLDIGESSRAQMLKYMYQG